MSTYIPKQVRNERERIETKLDRELIERLELYCKYLESDRDYVIASALEIAFRKDKGFAEWLHAQPIELPSQSEAAAERTTGGEKQRPARSRGDLN